MKILFIDIDGVLNCWEGHTGGLLGIRRDKVEMLNRVVDVTGCKVVLSSSWRICYGKDETDKRLIAVGAAFHLLSATPCGGSGDPSRIVVGYSRSEEISQWLSERTDVTRYAIVDDDLIDGHDGCVVRTEMHRGLLPEHCERLIEILGTDG